MDTRIPAPEEEFIHVPDSSDPDWTESFGHWLYSPESNVALYFHFQRSAQNADLWRELVLIHRDDGTVLYSQSYGTHSDGRNPGANALRVECVEPFAEWRLSFDGAFRELQASQLRRGLCTGGVWQAGQVELNFQSHAPLWSQVSAPTSMQGIAKAHYEQPIKFEGEVRMSGRSERVAGLGLRDHSYGARKLSPQFDTLWFNAQFPSGRCLLISRFTTADKQTFDEAHITTENKIYNAEIVALNPLEHVSVGAKFHATLRSELGLSEIEGVFRHAVPISLMGQREHVPGWDSTNGGYLYYDGSLRYEWDGEIGSGSSNVVISTATQRKLAQVR